MRIARHLPRALALACFIIALITDAEPTRVLGAGWFIWTTAGFIAWVCEPLVNGAKGQ